MPIWCIQTSSYVTAWELLYHHFLAIHNIHARQEFARHLASLHVIDACTFGLCQFRWLLDARWAVASFAHMTAGGILYLARLGVEENSHYLYLAAVGYHAIPADVIEGGGMPLHLVGIILARQGVGSIGISELDEYVACCHGSNGILCQAAHSREQGQKE